MKNNKKLAIFTSALILTAGIGIGTNLDNIMSDDYSVISADDAVFEGFKYIVVDGEVTITGYTEDLDLTKVVIPDEINGKPVTVIDKLAFNYANIISLTMGNNVTTIRSSAFSDCNKLTSVDLGRNLTSIGDNAFNGCDILSKVTISDNIESIKSNSFLASPFSQLIVPASVKSIPNVLYTHNTLTKITVDEENKVYSSDDKGVLYNKDKSELIKYPQSATALSFTAPESTATIKKSAFDNNINITTVVLSNVATIEDSAFYNCSKLSEINLGRHVTYIGADAFKSTTSLSKVTISDNIEFIGNNALLNATFSELVIPATVELIPADFYSKSSLKKITVDEENKVYSSDDKGVLYNKDKSELIKYPQSATALSFTAPESTATIKKSAFDNNINITTVVLSNVATIEDSAFYNCSKLSEINLGRHVTYIGADAFKSTTSLSKVTISDNIEFIGNNALLNATFSELVIPATVELIPADFYSKSSLKKITVDEENKVYSSDDKGVLYNKDKSELIKCPTSIELDKYSIANTTKTIKASAFNETRMATLVIPESVTTIEKNVFSSSNLKTIEGYTGSYAETFAAENKYEFVSLGDAGSTPSDPVTPPSTEGKLNYDVDGNGSINVMDLLKLKKYLLG